MKINYLPRRSKLSLTLFLFGLSIVTLSACGDSATATSLPATTTAATVVTTPTTSSSSSTNSAGTGAASNPTRVAGNGAPNPPLVGSVTSYDTTSKLLEVKAADGTSQKLMVLPNSRINKPVKITLAELGPLANGTNNITVMAQKSSDGSSYNATALTIIDQASMLAAFGPNIPAGANGANGRGGTPNANSPGPADNTTPGAGAGAGRPAGPAANGTVQVLRGTLAGNKLSGTDISGAPIIVNLSDTTTLVKLIAGSLEDLKAGVNVSVISRPSQDNTVATAAVINLVQP